MKIICGTDFSVHAAEAASFAAALAARRKGTLKLVHAISPAEVVRMLPAQVDWLRQKAGRKLVAEGNRLRGLGATVMESLVVGRPHEVLMALAEDGKADLIVVSSLGHCLAMRWLTGSVAERTAQNARVPTLIVRDYKRLLPWAEGKRPLDVFVGNDLSRTSDAALRWVASLREVGRCRITVTCLSWPEQGATDSGNGAGAADEHSAEVQAWFERELKARCDAALDGEEAHLHVAAGWGRRDWQLINIARSAGAELMVVGTNQRRGLRRLWMGSVSRGIIRHALTNVACVPALAVEATVRDAVPAVRELAAWPGVGPRLAGAVTRLRKRPVATAGT